MGVALVTKGTGLEQSKRLGTNEGIDDGLT